MSVATPSSERVHFRTLSTSDITREIQNLERRHGTYETLLDKAARELLTADERAALRRIDGLRFLRDGR